MKTYRPNEYRISRHAKERFIDRGIKMEHVMDAIRYGDIRQGDDDRFIIMHRIDASSKIRLVVGDRYGYPQVCSANYRGALDNGYGLNK